MIPKIIHYIWLGNKPLPKRIESNYKVIGKDWKVKIWTDADFAFNECKFIQESKSINQLQFCSDALRVWILLNHGGVYLDADVELYRTPDDFLELEYCIGREEFGNHLINTGVLLAEPGCKFIRELWSFYQNISFLHEGWFDCLMDTDRMQEFIAGKDVYFAESIKDYKHNISKHDLVVMDKGIHCNGSDFSFCRHLHDFSWKPSDMRPSWGENIGVLPQTKIPKIIHYCWISGEENMPEDIRACLNTWREHLPDYKFINWNDKNFWWNTHTFTKYCREHNMYAFCADFVRYWALYHYGGFYLDTDVRVYKSFEDLRSLERVLTLEVIAQDNSSLEAAILGCRVGDVVFKRFVDWYENCNPEGWDNKSNHIIAPIVMKEVLSNFKVRLVSDICEVSADDVIDIIDPAIYFRADSDLCFAQHQFNGSWCGTNTKNCFNVNDYKVFLCAHKPIDNFIPRNKKYVILDTTGNAENIYNDNFHEKIDISKDEFVRNHNICYSEGCAIHYLWKHPDLIPSYIVFGHYRRMFLDFSNYSWEVFFTRRVDNCGAIISKPVDHSCSDRKTNRGGMYLEHPRKDNDVLIQTVADVAPEYSVAFRECLEDTKQYPFNCFAMKKEDFLEMCEINFRILYEFDRRRGYKNNVDVQRSICRAYHGQRLRNGFSWQVRLQGFYLEWLTDTYMRYKYGVNNCYQSHIGIPNEIKKTVLKINNVFNDNNLYV